MKITVHLEGKNRAELADGLRAHLALIEGDKPETDTGKGKRGKKGAPEKTVSEDEGEDFGDKELEEDDLKEDDEDKEEDESEDESDDEEESEDEDEEEEQEAGPSFDEVRKAVNKYGKSHPKETKTLLLTFNIKSLKELQAHPKKWEPILRKVNLKLKGLKKSK